MIEEREGDRPSRLTRSHVISVPWISSTASVMYTAILTEQEAGVWSLSRNSCPFS